MKSVIVLMSLAMLVGCEKQKKEQIKPIANDLPALLITTTQGAQILTKNLSGKTVLVLFQPDCDHCQREAKQIRENLNAFRAYEMYFISTASRDELEKFSSEYQFTGEPAVHFASASFDNIISSLGSIDAPSVYVFSAEGKLVKHFNGEVEISEILQVL